MITATLVIAIALLATSFGLSVYAYRNLGEPCDLDASIITRSVAVQTPAERRARWVWLREFCTVESTLPEVLQ